MRLTDEPVINALDEGKKITRNLWTDMFGYGTAYLTTYPHGDIVDENGEVFLFTTNEFVADDWENME